MLLKLKQEIWERRFSQITEHLYYFSQNSESGRLGPYTALLFMDETSYVSKGRRTVISESSGLTTQEFHAWEKEMKGDVVKQM